MESILDEKGGFDPFSSNKGTKKRGRSGAGAKFLVRWQGYDSTHDSWEPVKGIEAGAPIAVAKWVMVQAKKTAAKPGVLTQGARVKVKFGKAYFTGTVTALGRQASGKSKAAGFHDRRFSVLFESDGETWKVVPGEHIYKVL